MRIEFDPAKSTSKWRKYGLSLDEAELLDWDAAIYRLDQRSFYAEWRALVMAPLAGRLHIAIFTERCGVLRTISLRKANARERTWYDSQTRG